MEVIERVFLLQRVDSSPNVPSHHLAHIPLLTREVEADEGAVLLQADEPADAMYVVSMGSSASSGQGSVTVLRRSGEAIGALAFLDDTPLGLEARVSAGVGLFRLTSATRTIYCTTTLILRSRCCRGWRRDCAGSSSSRRATLPRTSVPCVSRGSTVPSNRNAPSP